MFIELFKEKQNTKITEEKIDLDNLDSTLRQNGLKIKLKNFTSFGVEYVFAKPLSSNDKKILNDIFKDTEFILLKNSIFIENN